MAIAAKHHPDASVELAHLIVNCNDIVNQSVKSDTVSADAVKALFKMAELLKPEAFTLLAPEHSKSIISTLMIAAVNTDNMDLANKSIQILLSLDPKYLDEIFQILRSRIEKAVKAPDNDLEAASDGTQAIRSLSIFLSLEKYTPQALEVLENAVIGTNLTMSKASIIALDKAPSAKTVLSHIVSDLQGTIAAVDTDATSVGRALYLLAAVRRTHDNSGYIVTQLERLSTMANSEDGKIALRAVKVAEYLLNSKEFDHEPKIFEPKLYNILKAAARNYLNPEISQASFLILKKNNAEFKFALEALKMDISSTVLDTANGAIELTINILLSDQFTDVRQQFLPILQFGIEKLTTRINEGHKKETDAEGVNYLRFLGRILTKLPETEIGRAYNAISNTACQYKNTQMQTLSFEILLDALKTKPEQATPYVEGVFSALRSKINIAVGGGALEEGLSSISAISQFLIKANERNQTTEKYREICFYALKIAAVSDKTTLYTSALENLQRLVTAKPKITGATEVLQDLLSSLAIMTKNKKHAEHALDALGFAAKHKIGTAKDLFMGSAITCVKSVNTERAVLALTFVRKYLEASDYELILNKAAGNRNPEIAIEALKRLKKIRTESFTNALTSLKNHAKTNKSSAGRAIEIARRLITEIPDVIPDAIQIFMNAAIKSDLGDISAKALHQIERLALSGHSAAAFNAINENLTTLFITHGDSFIDVFVHAARSENGTVKQEALATIAKLTKDTELLRKIATPSADDREKPPPALLKLIEAAALDAESLLRIAEINPPISLQAIFANEQALQKLISDKKGLEFVTQTLRKYIKTFSEVELASWALIALKKVNSAEFKELLDDLQRIAMGSPNDAIAIIDLFTHTHSKNSDDRTWGEQLLDICSRLSYLESIEQQIVAVQTLIKSKSRIPGAEVLLNDIIARLEWRIQKENADLAFQALTIFHKCGLNDRFEAELVKLRDKVRRAEDVLEANRAFDIAEKLLNATEISLSEEQRLTAFNIIKSISENGNNDIAIIGLRGLFKYGREEFIITIGALIDFADESALKDRVIPLINQLILDPDTIPYIVSILFPRLKSDSTKLIPVFEKLSAEVITQILESALFEDPKVAARFFIALSITKPDLFKVELKKLSEAATGETTMAKNAHATLQELIAALFHQIEIGDKAAIDSAIQKLNIIVDISGDLALRLIEKAFAAIIDNIKIGVIKGDRIGELLRVIYHISASSYVDKKARSLAFASIIDCALDDDMNLYTFGIVHMNLLIDSNSKDATEAILNSPNNINFISRLLDICNNPDAYKNIIPTAINILTKILEIPKTDVLNKTAIELYTQVSSSGLILILQNIFRTSTNIIVNENIVTLLLELISNAELKNDAINALIDLAVKDHPNRDVVINMIAQHEELPTVIEFAKFREKFMLQLAASDKALVAIFNVPEALTTLVSACAKDDDSELLLLKIARIDKGLNAIFTNTNALIRLAENPEGLILIKQNIQTFISVVNGKDEEEIRNAVMLCAKVNKILSGKPAIGKLCQDVIEMALDNDNPVIASSCLEVLSTEDEELFTHHVSGLIKAAALGSVAIVESIPNAERAFNIASDLMKRTLKTPGQTKLVFSVMKSFAMNENAELAARGIQAINASTYEGAKATLSKVLEATLDEARVAPADAPQREKLRALLANADVAGLVMDTITKYQHKHELVSLLIWSALKGHDGIRGNAKEQLKQLACYSDTHTDPTYTRSSTTLNALAASEESFKFIDIMIEAGLSATSEIAVSGKLTLVNVARKDYKNSKKVIESVLHHTDKDKFRAELVTIGMSIFNAVKDEPADKISDESAELIQILLSDPFVSREFIKNIALRPTEDLIKFFKKLSNLPLENSIIEQAFENADEAILGKFLTALATTNPTVFVDNIRVLIGGAANSNISFAKYAFNVGLKLIQALPDKFAIIVPIILNATTHTASSISTPAISVLTNLLGDIKTQAETRTAIANSGDAIPKIIDKIKTDGSLLFILSSDPTLFAVITSSVEARNALIDQLFIYLGQDNTVKIDQAIAMLTKLKTSSTPEVANGSSTYIKDKIKNSTGIDALFHAATLSDKVIPFIGTLVNEILTSKIIFDKFHLLASSDKDSDHNLMHKLRDVIIFAAAHPTDTEIAHMGRRALIKGITSEHSGLMSAFVPEVVKHATNKVTAEKTIDIISEHNHHHPELIHQVLKPIAADAHTDSEVYVHAYKAIIRGVASTKAKFAKSDHTFAQAAQNSLNELAISNPERTFPAILANIKDVHLDNANRASLLDVMIIAAKTEPVKTAPIAISHLLTLAIDPCKSDNDAVQQKATNGLIDLLKTKHVGKVWENSALALISISISDHAKFSKIAVDAISGEAGNAESTQTVLRLITQNPGKGKEKLIDLLKEAALSKDSASKRQAGFEALINAQGSDDPKFSKAAFDTLQNIMMTTDLHDKTVLQFSTAANSGMISMLQKMDTSNAMTKKNVVKILISIIINKADLIPEALTALIALGSIRELFKNMPALKAAFEKNPKLISEAIESLSSEAGGANRDLAKLAVLLAARVWRDMTISDPVLQTKLMDVVLAGINNKIPGLAELSISTLVEENEDLFSTIFNNLKSAFQDTLSMGTTAAADKIIESVEFLKQCGIFFNAAGKCKNPNVIRNQIFDITSLAAKSSKLEIAMGAIDLAALLVKFPNFASILDKAIYHSDFSVAKRALTHLARIDDSLFKSSIIYLIKAAISSDSAAAAEPLKRLQELLVDGELGANVWAIVDSFTEIPADRKSALVPIVLFAALKGAALIQDLAFQKLRHYATQDDTEKDTIQLIAASSELTNIIERSKNEGKFLYFIINDDSCFSAVMANDAALNTIINVLVKKISSGTDIEYPLYFLNRIIELKGAESEPYIQKNLKLYSEGTRAFFINIIKNSKYGIPLLHTMIVKYPSFRPLIFDSIIDIAIIGIAKKDKLSDVAIEQLTSYATNNETAEYVIGKVKYAELPIFMSVLVSAAKSGEDSIQKLGFSAIILGVASHDKDYQSEALENLRKLADSNPEVTFREIFNNIKGNTFEQDHVGKLVNVVKRAAKTAAPSPTPQIEAIKHLISAAVDTSTAGKAPLAAALSLESLLDLAYTAPTDLIIINEIGKSDHRGKLLSLLVNVLEKPKDAEEQTAAIKILRTLLPSLNRCYRIGSSYPITQ